MLLMSVYPSLLSGAEPQRSSELDIAKAAALVNWPELFTL